MQSLTVAIDNGQPTAYNTTISSPGCTSGGSYDTCTFTLAVDAGTHTIAIVTYDAENGAGDILSQNSVSETINPGQANTLTIILNGVVASIQLALANAAPTPGTWQSISLTVNAYDATGNLIVGGGRYSTYITLNDSDTTGATAFRVTPPGGKTVNEGTKATIIWLGTTISLFYTGGFISNATISASCGSVQTSGWENATLTPAMSHDSWATAASMPTGRAELAAASLNGVIYAIGGLTGSSLSYQATNALEAYNPTTNQWTAETPMPTARSLLAAASVNGLIFAVGGFGYLNTVEAYDPPTNTWKTMAPMPTGRQGLSAGVINGILYAVGGSNGNGLVGTVEAYDLSSNTWAEKAPMPTPRYNFATGVIDNVLYAVGGDGAYTCGSGQCAQIVGTVEAYDPSTDSWSEKAPMPTARDDLAVEVVNGILYAIGGHTPTSLTDAVEAYDPSTNSWSSRASMPAAAQLLASGSNGGVLFTIGGAGSGSAYLNSVEAYQP
jgi:N-acetylneuraminic acid mutarotase